MQEKRRHPRVVVQIPVACEGPDGASFPGIVVDVSVGGVYVEAEVVPVFGAQLHLVGNFPGSPGLRLPAVVRWVKPGGFGVQFGLLGARETHVLTTMMHKSRV